MTIAKAPATPVAVIGMGCRLPGRINSPEQLWGALLRGDDLVTEIPAERWDADEYYDPGPGMPGRSVSRWGSFLDDVAGFDCEFFGVAEREAAAIDPQHRLLLETSWEAVEHAGMNPADMAGSATGVFIGLTHEDYAFLAADAHALEGPYGYTGTNFSMASGRIAHALGIQGPAVTVDTACSSSMFALHTACRSLHEGESDLALVGGASILLEPRKMVSASAQGMLSPTGRCHVFDVAADGFVASEGSAVLLLKRLPDAVRDHDRILAVVRGTAANQDGRTVNIATPSLDAQVAVYRAALLSAGVDAATVGMVEAHGTGTPVGDPIEYASLARVYGIAEACALGSVKSNFGHGQAASGAMGLMKAVLALQHGVVPRSLHFTRLPDDLALIETKMSVPQANTLWPSGHHPRRAAVSSYGLSGTNVHAILEQAPVEHARGATRRDTSPSPTALPLLFPVSSTSAEELRRTARRLADWVEERRDGHGSTAGNGIALSDLAYTLMRRRAHRSVRTSVLASSFAELAAGLRGVADGDTPYHPAVGQDDRGPVWVFSGQGSQWAGMGAELLTAEPVFAASVAEAEQLILRESGFSVTEAMSGPQTVTGGERVQPTLFAMQVALAATMMSYGVRPSAVIGHSMGEVAAAVVAGGLSLHDGVRVICRRSRVMSRIAGAGAMASVELPAHLVLSELAARGATDVVLSIVASPQSAVVGGATQTIRDLVSAWEQRGVMAREVAMDVAAHSPQVEPILAELADELTDLHPMTPTVPVYSATSYDPRARSPRDAGYWVENLRHMVRFAAAVQAALEDGYRVFAEMAPHPLLTHAVEQNASSLDIRVAVLTSMRRAQPLRHGLRGFVADLHSAGAAVDFSVQVPEGRLVDAPLPTWTHRPLLLTRDSSDPSTRRTRFVSVHPLLGSHVRLHEEPERHAWEADVGTAALPWLGDHRIHNVAALPAAAYCEMALAAARTVLGQASEVRDIRFEQLLLLDDETRLGAVASVDAPGRATFVAETDDDAGLQRRATAVLQAAEDDGPPIARDIGALLADRPNRVEGTQVRQWFRAGGLQFGSTFAGLVAAHTGQATDSAVLAEIGLPGGIRSQQAAYVVHPALLDACFQAVAAHPAIQASVPDGLLMPVGVSRLRCCGAIRNARYCYGRPTRIDAAEVEADLEILDEHGNPLLTVTGLLMRTGLSDDRRAERKLAERLLTIEWRHRSLPADTPDDAGEWLLISTSDMADVLTSTLADFLKLVGAQCTSVCWPLAQNHPADTKRLQKLPGVGATTRVVVVTSPSNGNLEMHHPDRAREHVSHLVRIVRELAEPPGEPSRLYVITHGAQIVLPDDVANLEQGGLRGLMRVIGAEHPHLHPTQIDTDAETEVRCLAEQLLSGSEEDEAAWRNGEWYVARLCRSPLRPEERRSTVVHHGRDGMRVEIRAPGDMQTMELVASERVPPGRGQIEVMVAAAGVNFADVLVAFGQYPSFDGQRPPFGADFSGVVTAVGPDVTDHRVGDHVGGVSTNGCWSTFVTCDAELVVTMPPGLTDSQAAAMPTAYATAWYGLHDLARISSSDKALIHSATGGVGQAAIGIARAAGAEIFATAGSPERRELLRTLGIEHIYDSRSTEFAELIRNDTEGHGVDIVLNSLTGAAQRAGLDLLAFGGRFIEIGKRDIYGDTRLGLFPFRRNLAFHGVDLALLTRTHPAKVRELLQRVYHLTADGTLPPPKTTHYPLSDTATAVRMMSAAEHTGKLVLDAPHHGLNRVVVPPEQARVFRRDGAYVITGGLGGLGLHFAEKMAAAGCGRIVLTSRSRPDTESQATIERIRSTGADIHVECGDITDSPSVDRVIAAATVTGLPVRGVLHAAAVIEDATLANITDELIDNDWAAKVNGGWNLHRATANQPLDWFCVFSSAAALVGSPGQGAYAAANSWLDAFTHWRRTQGLPATAIAWGAWAEIGRASALGAAGADTAITPDEGAYAFEALLRHDRAYTGYVPITGATWLPAFAHRSPFAHEFRSTGQTRTDTSQFGAELMALPQDEWPSRLRQLITEQISLILRRTIDPDRALTEYGLDSLANLELRTRIETETGVRIGTTDITTARGLAGYLCEKISASKAAPT